MCTPGSGRPANTRSPWQYAGCGSVLGGQAQQLISRHLFCIQAGVDSFSAPLLLSEATSKLTWRRGPFAGFVRVFVLEVSNDAATG